MSTDDLSAVLAEHAAALTSLPGVVGTAEGRTDDGTPCILLLLADAPPPTTKFPESLGGHPVHVRIIGTPEARETDEDERSAT